MDEVSGSGLPPCPPSSVETIWTNLVDAAAFLVLVRFTSKKGRGALDDWTKPCSAFSVPLICCSEFDIGLALDWSLNVKH